jgi:hypothetical protein
MRQHRTDCDGSNCDRTCPVICEHEPVMSLNYKPEDVECRKCGALWIFQPNPRI